MTWHALHRGVTRYNVGLRLLFPAGERAATESVEDATSQVKIKEAFATPDNLRNCVAFLRSYAADKKAQASCAVVPAQQIAYPQVLFPMLSALLIPPRVHATHRISLTELGQAKSV